MQDPQLTHNFRTMENASSLTPRTRASKKAHDKLVDETKSVLKQHELLNDLLVKVEDLADLNDDFLTTEAIILLVTDLETVQGRIQELARDMNKENMHPNLIDAIAALEDFLLKDSMATPVCLTACTSESSYPPPKNGSQYTRAEVVDILMGLSTHKRSIAMEEWTSKKLVPVSKSQLKYLLKQAKTDPHFKYTKAWNRPRSSTRMLASTPLADKDLRRRLWNSITPGHT